MKTYSGVYETIAQFINRDDMDTIIPSMVRLAELEIYRFLSIKLNESTKVYGPADDPYNPISPPVDYKESRLIVANGHTLERITDQRYYKTLDGYTETDQPQYWTEIDGAIYILPWATESKPEEDWNDVEVILHYYSYDSSELLEMGSDAFIYGGLVHSAIYLKAPDKDVARYEARFQRALMSLEAEYNRQQYAGSTKQVTSAYS